MMYIYIYIYYICACSDSLNWRNWALLYLWVLVFVIITLYTLYISNKRLATGSMQRTLATRVRQMDIIRTFMLGFTFYCAVLGALLITINVLEPTSPDDIRFFLFAVVWGASGCIDTGLWFYVNRAYLVAKKSSTGGDMQNLIEMNKVTEKSTDSLGSLHGINASKPIPVHDPAQAVRLTFLFSHPDVCIVILSMHVLIVISGAGHLGGVEDGVYSRGGTRHPHGHHYHRH